ncbi:cytochrome P450 [Streptosporangium roseum]|uniref:Cytochrome P450 n=1 Tax=Streptosporangium roseum (strain ATCC 12428 / DSM 43021 / JCM 3005 / KCTC 9067 / NCIMB 10171 / NRRL 2505 / NI 9100) TaxID=479432 RepID=D2AY72_STRRD|nr:cytochrome P450 [Streptosporangium roseum]ACZ87082.1 cytochrome P450 [Streptosporangium roseum DSM 43021]
MNTRSPIPYPFQWTPPMEVPDGLRGLREKALVEVRLPSGDTAVMVTRYKDVRRLFADERLSKNIARPGVARISADNELFVDPEIDADPPDHTRMRGLVTKAFTARRIELLRPFAQAITDDLMEKMAEGRGPVDLNEALAFPLPILVICKLLGIPPEDRNKFRRLVDGFLSVTKLPPEEVEECRKGLWDYLVELIAAKRADPEDDLIGALIKARDEDDNRLSEHELHFWTQSLLIAGYVTTASQIGTGTAVLLHRRDLVEEIRADYSLVPSAVEELLRTQIMGSSIGTLRYALTDIELSDGTTIKSGSSVLLSEESANMDESVFTDPFTLDIRRKENHHMTFGAGIHYCVGAALARMELQVATESLLRRFPGIRLAVPADDMPRGLGGFMEGFSEIPVTW